MKSWYRILKFLLIILMISNGILYAEEHPIWNPTGDVATLLNNTYGVTSKLSEYLTMSDDQLRNQLNTSGANDSLNIDMVYITYDLALLYHLTKDTNYAHRAAVLLDRYAEVFPSWPDRVGSDRNGFWGDWFHVELNVARRLAEAYDLIYNSGVLEHIGAGTRDKLKSLLISIVQRDFSRELYIFNMAGSRPMAIVVFGRVLNDPELTHLGYWYYNKIMHEGYCSDGFYSEGSYHYGLLPTMDLTKPEYKFYLNGYSDPLGYTHILFDSRWDKARIDNYDVDSSFSDMWVRMSFVLFNNTLPDLSWAVMNDGTPTNYGMEKCGTSVPASESMLLGGIGHAVLAWDSGESQVQARLDFSPAVGHAHYDANHLIFYDKKTEVVGGTAYTEGNREWNTSTINQNLVVVNEQEQKWSYFVDRTLSPYVPGSPITPVSIKPMPNTNIHNNVILWEPGYKDFKDVQVVEVDALDAYDHLATRYNRILALVHISDNDVYLVDFFRLKGGTQYDWTLHGGHSIYSLSTNLSMTSTAGTLGGISFCGMGNTSNTWSAILDYADTKHRIMMCGKAETTVYKGVGLRSVVDGGYQDYVVARRQVDSSDSEDFLVVHETYTNAPHVQSIQQVQFEGDSSTAVGLKITLDGGIVDYIVHTLDPGPSYTEHRIIGVENFVIKGRFAHIRVSDGNPRWMNLIQGESLSYDSRYMSSTKSDYSFRGYVTKVNRKENGDSENSFEVDITLPNEGELDRKTLIVTWGNGWKWAYKIKSIVGGRIITDDEPGFNYNGKDVDMQYFPIQEHFSMKSYPGPVQFIIPGTAIMYANGEIKSTEGDKAAQKPEIPTPPTNLMIK